MRCSGLGSSFALQHSQCQPPDGYDIALCYLHGLKHLANCVQIVVYAGGANDFVLPEPEPEDDWVNANMEFLAEVLATPTQY